MHLRRGLGVYLAIPTALALLGGLWFGMSLRETPEEQLLAERLDALAAQTQILSDSFLNEIDRIKIEVQNRLPLNSQLKYWSVLKRQGNDLGAMTASATLGDSTSSKILTTLKEQQWELGKLIDIESIDRAGLQILQFKNDDYAIAWGNKESIYVAWIKQFKSLMTQERKTYLFNQSIDSQPHWTLAQARKILFEENQKLGVSYQIEKNKKTAMSAFARIDKTPWFIVVEQSDTSGLFAAPVPFEIRLGQGLAAFGVILLFGALAARGLEKKTKLKTYTASAPPPFATEIVPSSEIIEKLNAEKPAPSEEVAPILADELPASSAVAASTAPLKNFVFPKMLTMEQGLIEPKVEAAPAPAIEPPLPPIEAIIQSAAAKIVAEKTATKLAAKASEPMGAGAEVAGPVQFKNEIITPDYVDENEGRKLLSELQAQILHMSDKKQIMDRVCAAVTKLCESPVMFFEYRKDFKAALLSNTSGFARNKVPGAMSFPIADEAVNTITTSAKNKKVASLSNFQPLCRVILDRTGVAYFEAWAVTNQKAEFHGVLVVLQAGVQSAIHRSALARLLSGIGLSSDHYERSQMPSRNQPYADL